MIFLSLFIRAGKLCLYNLSKLVRAKFFVLKGSTGGGFWTLIKMSRGIAQNSKKNIVAIFLPKFLG